MKKLTTEEFIEKAIAIHGDRYDYSKVNYINAQTKVCIICKEHGEFWQKPYNHLNGNNCPLCHNHTWDTESFIEAAKKIHGDRYDYSKVEYKGSNEKVCLICNDKDRHGNIIGEFWQYPLSVLKGYKNSRVPRGEKEECWETRICPICGKEFKVRKKYEKITCSEECRKKYVDLHYDEINEKRTKSLKKTYSTWGPDDFKRSNEKAKKTCLLKYGVDSFSKTEEGRKICSMNMKKNKHDRDEKYTQDVLIPKYRTICEQDNLELLEFHNRFDCLVKCKKCGNVFTTKTLGYLTDALTTHRCKICYPINHDIIGPTQWEIEFDDVFKSLNVKYYKNYRSLIYPLEVDFYLPDYNIAFELDGLYWHSNVLKDDKYHLSKTLKCLDKGVKLIHIFEDEWKYKKEICFSRIKNMLQKSDISIGARKCEIREVNSKDTREFLEQNHIQGYCTCKYSYGLFDNNELVSIMTFSNYRKNLGRDTEENEYELTRFCNKINTNVSGGASRLLKHFIKTVAPKKIISYADRRWSNGELYEHLGFKFIKDSKPNYFYVEGFKRINRFAYRKSVLVEKYGCDKSMSEKEFTESIGLHRIYDCGSKLYELTI